MSKQKSIASLDESKYDMTSMIDIVFLLLVFFILMPFKTLESKIENHLPKDESSDSHSKKDDIESVKIEIKRNGSDANTHTGTGVTIKINGNRVQDLAELKVRLEEIRNTIGAVGASNVPLEVNADENVPFYFVLKTLDFSKLNGFVKVKFPDPPKLSYAQKPRGN